MAERAATFGVTFAETDGTMGVSFAQDNDFSVKFGGAQIVATGDYNALTNKPSIEGHTLVGDKSFKELGMDTLEAWEIEKILYLT